MLVEHSSTNTSRSYLRCGSPRRPSLAKRLSRTRLSRSHPPIFFSAPSHALEDPGHRGVADLHPAHLPQELAPLWQGRGRSRSVASADRPLRASSRPRRAWAWSRGVCSGPATFLGVPRSHVAFDRGDAHTEGTGGFDLGQPPLLYGLDDLLTQVFGVSVHPLMMPVSPTALQVALVAPAGTAFYSRWPIVQSRKGTNQSSDTCIIAGHRERLPMTG